MGEAKRRIKVTAVIIPVLLAMTAAACGKSEFAVNGNTEKRMTITAKNAEKDAFFTAGTLEVDDGEQIVISSDLEKGSLRVEIVGLTGTESSDDLPDMDGEAVITANLVRTDRASGTVPAGSYQLRAACLEQATGTVRIEVQPAPAGD